MLFCLRRPCECLTATVPVGLFGLYPQLQQEVPACGGHIVFAGVDSARLATTVQHCRSPLHRSPLSQLTARYLGIKAAFSVRPPPPLSPGHSPPPDSPPVTLHSQSMLCHLWEEGAHSASPHNPTLTKGLFGRKPLMVTEACGQPPLPPPPPPILDWTSQT